MTEHLSEQDESTLMRLADVYGSEVLIARLRSGRTRRKGAGRPKEIFNAGIIWGHVEFLRRHRAGSLTKASKKLAKILERYTPGVLVKSKGARKHISAKTIENTYKNAKSWAPTDLLLATIMGDTYNRLAHELADAPEKEPVPFLVKADGTMFDLSRMDLAQMIVHESPSYRSGITFIVAAPKKVGPKISK